jgi:hypothetical protein
MERTTPMAEHAIERQKPKKRAAVKDAKSAVAKKVAKRAANTEEERGARIVVLTDDPRRSVVIVPGCHIDSMRHKENAYFFEDGNELVGMIVEGGTVEYHPGDRTYVVRLTNGRHSAE